MHTAGFAGMALNGGRRINDPQFVGVGGHFDAVPGYHRNLGKQRARGFPTLAATAHMVMSALRSHGNLHLIMLTVTVQCAAGKILAAGLNAMVDGGM
jgi:hypothetical protein